MQLASSSSPSAKETKDTTSSRVKGSDTIRVDIARLDQLLNTAGEMVITKARITQQVENLIAAINTSSFAMSQSSSENSSMSKYLDNISLVANQLHDTTIELHRHTSSMQNEVMSTRMVPIGPLFNRFHRLVRDICRKKRS